MARALHVVKRQSHVDIADLQSTHKLFQEVCSVPLQCKQHHTLFLLPPGMRSAWDFGNSSSAPAANSPESVRPCRYRYKG